jgi:hypothetical protein
VSPVSRPWPSDLSPCRFQANRPGRVSGSPTSRTDCPRSTARAEAFSVSLAHLDEMPTGAALRRERTRDHVKIFEAIESTTQAMGEIYPNKIAGGQQVQEQATERCQGSGGARSGRRRPTRRPP